MKHTLRAPKRRCRTLLAAAVMAALLSPAAFPRAGAAAFDAHYTSASLQAQEQEAGNLLNSDRGRYNLPVLAIDPELSRIARIKSQDMLAGGYFSHTSPTYGNVRDMLTRFGYPYTAASENIARHSTLEKAQAALISSPGHRRNVLSTAFTKVGIGVATTPEGYVYVTQIFCR